MKRWVVVREGLGDSLIGVVSECLRVVVVVGCRVFCVECRRVYL